MVTARIRTLIGQSALGCLALVALTLAPSPAQAVPICIDDLCIEVPTPNESGYNVRAADFNSDGRTDLYVTGGYRRAVKDFIVLQNAPGPNGEFTFSVLATPSAAQRTQALALPMTGVAVYRTDLSGDGLFDFELENVDEVIPNAPDVIILTDRGQGDTPVKIIPETPEFLQLVESFEQILSQVDAVLNIYNSITCVPVIYYVPVYVYDPWYGEYGYYGYYTYMPVYQEYCFPTSMLFYGHYQTFTASLNDLKSSLPPGITSLVDGRLYDVLESRYGVDRVRMTRKLAQAIRTGLTALRYYRSAATVATVVLVADDATVVGVADDVAIPVVLLSIGGAFVIEASLEVLLERIEDAGPQPVAEPAAEADPYRVKSDCQPWGASRNTSQIFARVGRPPNEWLDPNSQRLRSNLDKAGCGCPPGTNINAAHHIVAKKAGGAIGDQLRACLSVSGVDLDEAGNGVCLPTSDNAKTRSLKHGAEGMHSNAYFQKLLDDCNTAYQNGGPQGVRNMLDGVRQKMADGIKFW